jgi:hypothetical protein
MIRPATAFVPEGELPVVWFSTQPFWEPTANKMIETADGRTTRLSNTQCRDFLGPLFRFGVPTKHLIPWIRLIKKARISKAEQRRLRANSGGSGPEFWHGSLESVPIKHTVVQKMNKDNEWEKFDYV